MRMVRQTAALICCHAASRGVVIDPALAKEIALDVHVSIEVPLGYRCVTEVLNVRAGPSADHERLFQIPEGQRVELWCDAQEGWGFVMWDGGEGWVSLDYLGDCPLSSTVFHEALRVETSLSLIDRLKNLLTQQSRR